MSLRDALLAALRALRAHWRRSTLTMFGLIIGVSAVVVLSACGLGVRNSVDARIEPVANNITIVSQAEAVPNGPPAQPLTDADALQNAPDIASIAPAVTGSPTPGATSTGTPIVTGTVSRTSRPTSSAPRRTGPLPTTVCGSPSSRHAITCSYAQTQCELY